MTDKTEYCREVTAVMQNGQSFYLIMTKEAAQAACKRYAEWSGFDRKQKYVDFTLELKGMGLSKNGDFDDIEATIDMNQMSMLVNSSWTMPEIDQNDFPIRADLN